MTSAKFSVLQWNDLNDTKLKLSLTSLSLSSFLRVLYCPPCPVQTSIVTTLGSVGEFASEHPCRRARVAVERDSRPSPVGAG